MLRDLLDKIDTYLVVYFGNCLEFRSLEFFLKWGKATQYPIIGKLFKMLFVWFCKYYAGFIIPYDGSVPAGTVVMPYENILEFVKRAQVASVLPCGCRTMRNPVDKTIPRATCMQFELREGESLRGRSLDEISGKDYNKGKWETPQKILDILKDCEDHGLVHQIMCFSNPQGRKTYVLCNCDGNSCIPNFIHTRYNVPFVRSSGFICSITETEKCTHCNLCVKRCIYKAVDFKEGQPVVDNKKCLGCGLCVSTCAPGIRKMSREPKELFHKITKEYLDSNPEEAMVNLGKNEYPVHIGEK